MFFFRWFQSYLTTLRPSNRCKLPLDVSYPKTIQQGKAQSLRRIEINFHGASTGSFSPHQRVALGEGKRSKGRQLAFRRKRNGVEGIALTKPPGFRATHIETAAVKWVIRIVELEPYSGTNQKRGKMEDSSQLICWGI